MKLRRKFLVSVLIMSAIFIFAFLSPSLTAIAPDNNMVPWELM